MLERGRQVRRGFGRPELAQPNNSLKPWEITRIPVKTSGTNGLRLTPREERRGPSAGGPPCPRRRWSQSPSPGGAPQVRHAPRSIWTSSIEVGSSAGSRWVTMFEFGRAPATSVSISSASL